MRRRLIGIIVLHQAQRHAKTGEELPTTPIVDLSDVFRQLIAVKKRGDGNSLFRLLVDHHGHAGAAIRMASAGELTPVVVSVVGMHQVSPIGERPHEADREPITRGLAKTSLILHVMREMAQGVTLRLTTLISDGLVATSKRNRLE